MRTWRWLIVVTIMLLPQVAQAQEELDPEPENLGWVALQWHNEGLSPDNPSDWPRLVEIAQAYGFMQDIQMWQVQYAVAAQRDLKEEEKTKRSGLVRVQFIPFTVQVWDAVQDWCREIDAKARALDRMTRSFGLMAASFTAWAQYTGPLITLPVVGIKVQVLLWTGAGVTSAASLSAGWLASDYRSAKQQVHCASGKESDSWINLTPHRMSGLTARLHFPS